MRTLFILLYGSELCEPYLYYYMVTLFILLYGSELCEPYLYYYMVVNYANLIYTTIW